MTAKPTVCGQSIMATLDRLGRLEIDITPRVFERYIEKFPESAKLFRILAQDQPPQGCGQMLFEILSVLVDLANEESYVDAYLKDLMTGHRAFGVRSLDLYVGFLNVVADTVADQLAQCWPQDEKDAWESATRQLQSRIAAAGADSIP